MSEGHEPLVTIQAGDTSFMAQEKCLGRKAPAKADQ